MAVAELAVLRPTMAVAVAAVQRDRAEQVKTEAVEVRAVLMAGVEAVVLEAVQAQQEPIIVLPLTLVVLVDKVLRELAVVHPAVGLVVRAAEEEAELRPLPNLAGLAVLVLNGMFLMVLVAVAAEEQTQALAQMELCTAEAVVAQVKTVQSMAAARRALLLLLIRQPISLLVLLAPKLPI